MTYAKTICRSALVALAVLGCHGANAAVTAEAAAKLKSELSPLGAERAANKDGTIPAWTGGYTTPQHGFTNGGRRPDPFAGEKPSFSINAKNMDQYSEKLAEGVKALMKKYPDFRIDVYPTHRTAAAPQWVYDNTFKNATQASLTATTAGPSPTNVFGGIPFPIPKEGIEAIWNHELRWRGYAFHTEFKGYMTTTTGQRVPVVEASNENLVPYYKPNGDPGKYDGESWLIRSFNSGPPIRAGEGIVGRLYTNEDRNATWVYLTGQRRVRKLPNSCCDTPTPFSAGIVSFDEVNVFTQRKERFDWKLVGKKEMFIPYNSNKTMVPTSIDDVVREHFLSPDHVRWELHRVWIVEASLKPGQRHTSPKSRYYLDEDTWMAVLADRWDANGQLARMPFQLPIVVPDLPGVVDTTWGVYDLLSGSLFVNVLYNESKEQLKFVPSYADALFTPDAMVGAGVR